MDCGDERAKEEMERLGAPLLLTLVLVDITYKIILYRKGYSSTSPYACTEEEYADTDDLESGLGNVTCLTTAASK